MWCSMRRTTVATTIWNTCMAIAMNMPTMQAMHMTIVMKSTATAILMIMLMQLKLVKRVLLRANIPVITFTRIITNTAACPK